VTSCTTYTLQRLQYVTSHQRGDWPWWSCCARWVERACRYRRAIASCEPVALLLFISSQTEQVQLAGGGLGRVNRAATRSIGSHASLEVSSATGSLSCAARASTPAALDEAGALVQTQPSDDHPPGSCPDRFGRAQGAPEVHKLRVVEEALAGLDAKPAAVDVVLEQHPGRLGYAVAHGGVVLLDVEDDVEADVVHQVERPGGCSYDE
jgi:hypothetical protein